MGRQNKFIIHDFYCLNCGQRNIPLPRKESHCHNKFHRKKLYCYKCKTEVNMIEIRTHEEKLEFITNFAKGVYKNEGKESLDYLRTARIG